MGRHAKVAMLFDPLLHVQELGFRLATLASLLRACESQKHHAKASPAFLRAFVSLLTTRTLSGTS